MTSKNGWSGFPTAAGDAVGFYQPPRIAELMGGVIVSQRSFDMAVPRAQNGFTLLAGDPTKAALQKALAAFPDTKVQTNAEFVRTRRRS